MVFETVELVEYESRRVRTASPSPDDLALAERLAPRGDLDARITVRWLAGGFVDIAASSWIGVIRFTNLEIRIVPKLVGDPLRVLRMLEYSGGVRLLAQLPIERELPAHGSDLFELIVMLLVQETQTLIRDGLIRDYRSVDDALVVMRGRLRIREQFLQRYGSFHRLECQFDEYDGDIPDNQLLAAALSAASRRVRDPELKTETHVLTHMLAGVCEPSARDAAWYRRRIQYGRRNARYRSAHVLATLVLDGLALTDLFSQSSGSVSAFMLNMNVVFERFVSRLVADSLTGSGLRVSTQESYSSVVTDDASGHSYTRIRPDLAIVEIDSGRTVPIDIKYKLYSTKKFSPADIYQTFLYAYALSTDAESPRAGLIYPATRMIEGPELRVNRAAGSGLAHIRGFGLDVPSALDALGGAHERALRANIVSAIRAITGFGGCDRPSDHHSAEKVPSPTLGCL